MAPCSASATIVRSQCLTRSEKGAVVVAGEDVHVVDAEPVAQVVDTTGAGDAYAAGFLWGLTRGLRLESCARVAGIAAAEAISHVGARAETSLAGLVRQKLGDAGPRFVRFRRRAGRW